MRVSRFVPVLDPSEKTYGGHGHQRSQVGLSDLSNPHCLDLRSQLPAGLVGNNSRYPE